MMTTHPIQVRYASEQDRQQLVNLLYYSPYSHRHLDWCSPVDWIGHAPFLVSQTGADISAALACPADLEPVVWIRFFAVQAGLSVHPYWDRLWHAVLEWVRPLQAPIASIPLQDWYRDLLIWSKFSLAEEVVVLKWEQQPDLSGESPVQIRKMTLADLPSVLVVDQAAFAPLWQISANLLETAWSIAALASVAEHNGQIVGYQISTANSKGGHLARLAVSPPFQAAGIGTAIVKQVLSQFQQWGSTSVTVNTQASNLESLALYKKLGFTHTDDHYPVYVFAG